MKRFPFRRHEVLSILAPEPAATETTNELSTEVARAPSADTPTNSSEVIGALAVHRDTEEISANVPPAAVVRDIEEISTNVGPGASPASHAASPAAPSESSETVAHAASPAAQNDSPEIASPVADQRPRDTVVLVMAPESLRMLSISPESTRRGRPAPPKLPPCDLAPNLLVAWQPAWPSFLASIRPAFLRKTTPLAGECRTGKFDLWSASISAAAHIAVVLMLLGVYQAHRTSQVLLQARAQRTYDVIYFSGPYLPPLEDRGGALTGVSGRSGGRELKHVQNIRVARGTKVVSSTVDAPDLKLPQTDKPVANLLAVRPVQPSAPVQALRSVLAKLGVTPEVVPPAPKVDVVGRAAPQLSAEVVPPSPDAASLNQKPAAQMKIDAVPAPVSAPVRDSDSLARLRLPADVVAPPPSRISRARALPHGMSGSPQVAPPPPELASLKPGSPTGLPNGVGSAEVVLPPPSAAEIADGALTSALNALSNAAHAAGIGKADAPGVIASAHPGKDVGIPKGAGAGEIALSDKGGNTAGRGGSGGGTGIGTGSGPGNAPSGTGPGSGNADIGPGAASGRGNSPAPGDGGAGNSPNATRSSGVWVASKMPTGSVSIPSFSNSGDASSPGHSPADPRRRRPGVTVIGTSRSGGALNTYGALPGSRVYTVYIDTDAGTAVLQYSSADSSGREFAQDLIAPEAVRAEVPADLRSTKFVVSCVVDRSGLLRNMRVLQNSAPDTVTRVLAMLHEWRFRPVLRGNAAIEVNAIVGFNIDTR